MRRTFPLFIVFLLLLGAGFLAWKHGQKKAQTPEDETLVAATTDDESFVVESPSQQWEHENSDISANERAVFGQLKNGMRYVIMRNAEPAKRISLRLHIDAGSLKEADDQRGVAHFLEHMVFNGTKSFKDADALIQQMQRLGIAFGAHANAYTSFDETVYMLDLPETSDRVVDLAFNVMRDFADGALLLKEEIDDERGVILSEKNSRDSVGFRIMEQQFNDLLPNSQIPKRLPIGTEEVIKSAGRDRFVDFYQNYYIPRDMTFVLVGDIDPKSAEELIQKSFASLKNPEKQKIAPDIGSVEPSEGFRIAVYQDKEVTSTDISLVTVSKSINTIDSVEKRSQDIPVRVAHAIMNRRFRELAKVESPVILTGSSADYDLFRVAHIASIEVSAVEGKNMEAASLLEKEYRRAIQHGFTRFELDAIRDEILSTYENAVKSEATQKSKSLANAIVQTINNGGVISSAKTDLDIIKAPLAALTPEACHAAFKKLWQDKGVVLMLTTNQTGADIEERLTVAYKRSQSVAVKAPENKKRKTWDYIDFGSSAEPTIVRVEDLDITQLTYPNGVRVNLKKTDFTKNSISIRTDIHGGLMTMPIDQPGISFVTDTVMNAGGLGKYNALELQSILAGKKVSSIFSTNESSFTLSGKSTPKDLTIALQLMAAAIVDPGYRPEALRQFRGFIPQIFHSLEYSEQGPLMKMKSAMYQKDPRYVFPSREELTSLTENDVKEWLTPALKTGYLEISLVGDMDISQTIAVLNSTFGALPQRNAKPTDHSSYSITLAPEIASKSEFTYESKIPKAITVVAWLTEGIRSDIKKTRRLSLLASVLSDRLREKLREELGATYSPRASSSQSADHPAIGFIQARSTGKPEDVDVVTKVIQEIAAELASHGVSDDEFDRALQPKLGMLKKSLRDNGYWLNTVISGSQAKPEKLDHARTRDEDYSAITAKDISDLAAEYLTSKREAVFIITPSGVGSETKE